MHGVDLKKSNRKLVTVMYVKQAVSWVWICDNSMLYGRCDNLYVCKAQDAMNCADCSVSW